MTSSQAAVVASAAAADNHAPSSQRHQPPNDDELTLRVEERERAPVVTVTVGAIKGSSGLLSRVALPLATSEFWGSILKIDPDPDPETNARKEQASSSTRHNSLLSSSFS